MEDNRVLTELTEKEIENLERPVDPKRITIDWILQHNEDILRGRSCCYCMSSLYRGSCGHENYCSNASKNALGKWLSGQGYDVPQRFYDMIFQRDGEDPGPGYEIYNDKDSFVTAITEELKDIVNVTAFNSNEFKNLFN